MLNAKKNQQIYTYRKVTSQNYNASKKLTFHFHLFILFPPKKNKLHFWNIIYSKPKKQLLKKKKPKKQSEDKTVNS